jgi:nucleoside-diphosphate-sugar epimerase
MNKTILITGISGFIGAHLGAFFSDKNYNIIGLKRIESDTWRCIDFYEKVNWIDLTEGWINKIIQMTPSIIIHSAWDGVTASDRCDLKHQIKNLDLLSDLLFIAKEVKLEKFIGFGSQEEYGVLNGIAYEDQLLKTQSEYGIAKIAAADIVNHFCEINNINWYWLRIFSIFGEKESYNWLIPSVIKKIYNNEEEIKMTSCQQKYAYLHISDFLQLVRGIVEKDVTPLSGIYNISGNIAIELREIVEKIKQHLEHTGTQTKLNFGDLKMRNKQSMHLEGAMNKYIENIGPVKLGNIDALLKLTIDDYVHSLSTNV